jgi:hypothetical protein
MPMDSTTGIMRPKGLTKETMKVIHLEKAKGLTKVKVKD